MNWLDLLIILALSLFTFIGFRRGFLIGIIELVGIIVSIGVPLLLYIPFSRVLQNMGISQVYAGALAFLILWFIMLNIYYWVARKFYRRIPRTVRRAAVNRVFGIFTGLLKGLLIVALTLTIFVALPIPIITSETVEDSQLAPPMLDAVSTATAYAADIFGEALQAALGFLTIQPEDVERIDLRFTVENPVIDTRAEEEMLRLVNTERTQRGLHPLEMDETIREVAREHSIDMFQQGYFAHISLDERTPFQRMTDGGVRFTAAGENIALAPTVSTAHSGLMKSPGHRENILRPQFRRIGIGAARGGRYGTMFTQNFAN